MRRRDAALFEQVYDRFSPLVLALILRILRQRDVAEEVMQDTFWQLWNHADRYDPERGRLSTYLGQMARSRALDHLRRERSQADRIQGARIEIEFDPPAHPSPLSSVIAGRDARLVRDAMQSLPEDYHSALTLFYYEGLKQREIATRLDLPLGTVKTHLRRGVEALRRALTQGGGA